MKKANAQQMFVYITMALVFGFILIYGYNAVSDFKGKGDQVAFIQFKSDISGKIKSISSDFGTVTDEGYFIGGDIQRVCFVQSYDLTTDKAAILAALDTEPIMKDSVESETGMNVFLFSDTLEESFDVGWIILGEGDRFSCAETINGRISLRFEGMGDHTKVNVI